VSEKIEHRLLVITVIVITELLTIRQKLAVTLLRKNTLTPTPKPKSRPRLDLLDLLSECAMNK